MKNFLLKVKILVYIHILKRLNINMVVIMLDNSQLRFMLYEKILKAYNCVKFLAKLTNIQKKTISDNLRV